MQYVKWAAKAVVAFVTTVIATAAGIGLDLDPWVIVIGTSIVAAVGVFFTNNGEAPTSE